MSTPKGPILLLALVFAGCGGEGEATNGGGTEGSAADLATAFCGPLSARVDSFMASAAENGGARSERYGGTVVTSGAADMSGLNPLVSADATTAQHHAFVHLMTLIRYDEDLEPIPWLAESWEVSPDSSAVTFHLRDDVYWHDGAKTTAEDVAFTYARMIDPETAFANATYWDQYAKGPDAVEVVDSFTVTVRMLRPHAEFLDPWRTSAIVPKHVLEDVPAGSMAQHPYGQRCSVGNGPFVFTERRAGESWTFEANPAFPEGLGGRPYLDRLVYRVISEPATALSELLTGGTHVYTQPPPEYADEIAAADGVELRIYPHRTYTFVGWNTRRPQLADARVRRALTLGLDRGEIVEALVEGQGRVANTTVFPDHWAYDPDIEGVLAHDPQRARRLLDEAGWTDRDGDGVRENADGLPLSIAVKYNSDNQTRGQVAEIMQARLGEIGVAIRPTPVEYNTLLDQVIDPERRDFDAIVLGFSNEFRMDDRDMFHSERLDGPFALAGLEDPELDRLMDTLQTVVDRDRARVLWGEYQDRLIELQPFTFLFWGDRLVGVSERLRGAEMDTRGEWMNVRDWWLAPEGGPVAR